MSSQYPVCPNCKQMDMVRQASQANVSMPLKPSDTIVKIVKVWRWVFGGLFGFFLLILVGAFLLAGCSMLLGSAYDETRFISLLSGTMLVPVLCVSPVALVVAGTIMVLLPWLVGKYVNQNYQKRFDQWRRAMDKYQKLWFCSRCAGVWLEGQNRIVPIEQIQSYLFSVPHRRRLKVGSLGP
ncbi:MAG: hypothetical protein ACP5NB_12830, partial [Chloroflexia bacterium]